MFQSRAISIIKVPMPEPRTQPQSSEEIARAIVRLACNAARNSDIRADHPYMLHAISTALDAKDAEHEKDHACDWRVRCGNLETLIATAHLRALPANWVYTDTETTLDLMVAETTALRTELDSIRAKLAELQADKEYCFRANVLNEEVERREIVEQQRDEARGKLAERESAILKLRSLLADVQSGLRSIYGGDEHRNVSDEGAPSKDR